MTRGLLSTGPFKNLRELMAVSRSYKASTKQREYKGEMIGLAQNQVNWTLED